MEGGEGNFFFPKFLKLKAAPLKEQKFNDDPPLHIRIFFFDPPPFSFLLVKWGFPGIIVLIIK
jgi:hypothetical protein